MLVEKISVPDVAKIKYAIKMCYMCYNGYKTIISKS